MNFSQLDLHVTMTTSRSVMEFIFPKPLSPAQPLITEQVYNRFVICVLPIIEFFSVVGIITNLVNIVVFAKLGRAESTNISFQALAICDLVLSVLNSWTYTVIALRLAKVQVPFDTYSIHVLTGTALCNFVVRWGALMTAYISLERCLCVLKPLQVKRILTPRVTTVAVMVMLVFTVSPAVYLHFKYKFVWKDIPHQNRTVLGVTVIRTPGVVLFGTIVNIFAGLIQPIGAFVLVVICTVYLGIHLGRASAWRRGATSGAETSGKGNQKETATSQKENRVLRMVVSIAVVFIICVTPSTVHMFTLGIFQKVSFDPKYKNVLNTMFVSSSLGSSVNASVNFFIYYSMGSRYRAVCRQLFGILTKDSPAK